MKTRKTMSFKKYKKKILKDPRSKKLIFKSDDRNHYVYRVSKNGLHYYGSRTDYGGKTIGDGYYTSSSVKSFQKDFKKNRCDYKVKVIKYFNNPGDKIIFESYLHQYFNVKEHPNFINKCNQEPFGFNITGISINAKIVLKIDKHTGIILEEFSSAIKAQDSIIKGNVAKCLLGDNKTAGGYIWIYKKEYNPTTFDIINHVDPTKKIVYKLDIKSLEIMEEFESMSAAEKSIGKNKMIGGCLRHEVQTAYGAVWVYKEDYEVNREEIISKDYNRSNKKPIYQTDGTTKEIIAEFVSAAEAIRQTGIKGIKNSANKNNSKKLAGGYAWVYVQNYKEKSK